MFLEASCVPLEAYCVFLEASCVFLEASCVFLEASCVFLVVCSLSESFRIHCCFIFTLLACHANILNTRGSHSLMCRLPIR